MYNSCIFKRKHCMQTDLITKFIEPTHVAKTNLKIEFKKRNTIIGVFINSPDYEDLKVKNFWRIVTENQIPEWRKTNDIKLARIFSGSEFTKLSVAKEK